MWLPDERIKESFQMKAINLLSEGIIQVCFHNNFNCCVNGFTWKFTPQAANSMKVFYERAPFSPDDFELLWPAGAIK